MSAARRLAVRFVAASLLGVALFAPAPCWAAEGPAGSEHAATNPVENWTANLSLWSAVVFLVFLAVLTKLAWRPLSEGLDARERRIREDIAAAEQSRLKAEQMLAEHAAKLDRVQDEVKAILAEARRDAEVARQNIVSNAQAEADATKTRAVSEIERARDQALKELFDTMAGRVADATERVLGRGLTDADQQRLIEEALNGFAQRPMAATRA